MTVNELTRILKIRLRSPDSDDELLASLLDEARNKILSYTNRPEDKWLGKFDAVAVGLAAAAYNRLGAEGYQSRTEGDVSTAFDIDGGDKLLIALSQYRLAGV